MAAVTKLRSQRLRLVFISLTTNGANGLNLKYVTETFNADEWSMHVRQKLQKMRLTVMILRAIMFSWSHF